MCNTCCKECYGWCRAFTVTEILLTILEAILLVFFISFLTFLILHLLACSDSVEDVKTEDTFSTIELEEINSSHDVEPYHEPAQTQSKLPQDIECTWTPLEKTRSITQYYENSGPLSNVTIAYKRFQDTMSYPFKMSSSTAFNNELKTSGQSVGEIADDKKPFVMALVKMMSPFNITFGCILTIVSEFWTVTSASCIESVKEIDNLQSFIMIDNFGDLNHGRRHVVKEMVVHPQYQNANKTYDIMMIKSADNLTSNRKTFLQLPTIIDYFLIPIGEKLSILGFRKFRSSNKGPISGSVNEVAVHMLPSQRCNTLNLPFPGFMLCVGILYSQGIPCNYCAGTPLLLRGAILVGIMSGIDRCDASCNFALYVNIALIKDWMNSVIEND